MSAYNFPAYMLNDFYTNVKGQRINWLQPVAVAENNVPPAPFCF